MIPQNKINSLAYTIGFQTTVWILNISIVMLCWNYLCAEFFGAEKLTIEVTAGLLVIKSILFNPNKSEQEETQIKTFN